MENLNEYKNEIEIQKRIAYTAGLLQDDVTIKTLLESLAEGVVIVNESGRIILINDRLSELTGYLKQEVMGESLNIFLDKELHHMHDQHIKNYFSQPRIRPMGIGFELVAKRKNDEKFPVEISLSYLNTEAGKLGVAFLTDISSRKKAENELKTRNKELDSYARTVAHNLNSSLTGMVGFSELLMDSDGEISNDERQLYLKSIAQNGRKMSNIINELLLFATIRKEDVDIRKVEMKKIIDSVLQRLRFQIEHESAQIVVNENISDCLGYASWIEETWFNYISNALKYGGKPPIIEIGCEKTDSEYIKYYVKDSGPGISAELKAVIFQDKNKIKDKLTKGIGLGLSIVKRIVEKLDGFVSVESEIGKGSKFSFHMKVYSDLAEGEEGH